MICTVTPGCPWGIDCRYQNPQGLQMCGSTFTADVRMQGPQIWRTGCFENLVQDKILRVVNDDAQLQKLMSLSMNFQPHLRRVERFL